MDVEGLFIYECFVVDVGVEVDVFGGLVVFVG